MDYTIIGATQSMKMEVVAKHKHTTKFLGQDVYTYTFDPPFQVPADTVLLLRMWTTEEKLTALDVEITGPRLLTDVNFAARRIVRIPSIKDNLDGLVYPS